MSGMTVHLSRLGQRRDYRPLLVHEGNHVVDEKRPLVYRCGRRDKRADSGGNAGQRTGVEREVTDLILSPRHPAGDIDKQQAVDDRRDERNPDLKPALLKEQLLQPAEILRKYAVVPVDEGIGQPEHSDLLDHVLVGHKPGIIAHHAPVL